MSARKMAEGELWEVHFAYQGKTCRHWRAVLMSEGTQREAEQRAQKLYNQDLAAVDFLVVPAEIADKRETPHV